jgi:hypothetical protein
VQRFVTPTRPTAACKPCEKLQLLTRGWHVDGGIGGGVLNMHAKRLRKNLCVEKSSSLSLGETQISNAPAEMHQKIPA